MQNIELHALEASLDDIRLSPREGTIELIVRRPSEGEREVLDEVELDPVEGVVGDRWYAGGRGELDRQVTLMNSRAAAVIAQTRERWPLAGDQLYIDMDLGRENLPPGSHLAIGSVVLEVSPLPHTDCRKFVARFGIEAMEFVNSPVGKQLCLRGINAKVIQGGIVKVGQTARKISNGT